MSPLIYLFPLSENLKFTIINSAHIPKPHSTTWTHSLSTENLVSFTGIAVTKVIELKQLKK